MGGGDVRPYTKHVGKGSGWRVRLVVMDGKPILFSHGDNGPWFSIAKADATDRAWLRASKWTPPLPSDMKWP